MFRIAKRFRIPAAPLFLAAAFFVFVQTPARAAEFVCPAPRLRKAVDRGDDLPAIVADAVKGAPGTLARFRRFRDADGSAPVVERFLAKNPGCAGVVRRLEEAAGIVERARRYARTALGNVEYDESRYIDFIAEATALGDEAKEIAAEASRLVLDASVAGGNLLDLRRRVFVRLQREANQGSITPAARLAWGLLRVAVGNDETEIEPDSVAFEESRASLRLVHNGVSMAVALDADDFEKRLRAEANGYRFVLGWSVLFQKPLGWVAAVAVEMRNAGVDPLIHPEWEVVEAPEGLAAIAPPGQGDRRHRRVFYKGAMYDVTSMPVPASAGGMADDFRAAAKRLHEGVMGDERLPRRLRQALNPILMGAYLPIDSRDYFDAAFCRRLIEADYLEKHIGPLPPERARELAAYREALGKMEAGYDEFVVELGYGRRMFAVVGPDFAGKGDGGAVGDKDVETGETVPRYSWRVEGPETTVFYDRMPGRGLYALSLAEHYAGRHRTRPAGVPFRTEVWHAVLGRLLAYDDGADRAVGEEADWRAAVVFDARGRLDPTSGPLGWNFPPHVLQRDDQGDPVLLATHGGVVRSPDLAGLGDAAARRRAAEEWLDHAAGVLREPGELNLIFTQFFRYCSDSPIPEMPNLVGSHYGLSDTHQTVHQTLERRWVGRLIGDCDDLAEFFQELTTRQGRLSHVMQLPSHAAAGYCEPLADGRHEFVVLQTGPVLRFVADSAEEAVEMAYRHFDENSGKSRFTSAAVPLLLRFADEETRTPFVLSSRIYWDRDYAEAMIRVQGYWHLHVFSAAIAEMEAMLESDREIGSIKELASLYNRVGRYEESAELRREELTAVRGDASATLSTLLDIAQMHIQDGNRGDALAALGEMEELMLGLESGGRSSAFARALPFRSYWALLLSRLGEPERAWTLMRRDVDGARRAGVFMGEVVLRTLVGLYDRMSRPDRDGVDGDARTVRDEIGLAIEEALAKGYFKADDSYNNVIRRYHVIGRYAVAREGRKAGLARLLADGPYPAGPKDHAGRGSGVSDEDWQWARISPQLFMTYAFEALDREDYPELYDPQLARSLLAAVARSVEKGTGLGSDVVGGEALVRSRLILALLDGDLSAFREAMAEVRSRDYASLYDDAALVFGEYCGLVPLDGFPAWIEEFRRFFPGRQNYFKAAYRALDKSHFGHALMMAGATARFFSDDPLLVGEAAYLAREIPRLEARRFERTREPEPGEPASL